MADPEDNGLFQAFLNWLYSTGDIQIPDEFHLRCSGIQSMIDNDVTGVINTTMDYAINSASEALYKIESDNNTVETLLNKWLSEININIDGFPTGLQELAKEYFKERWNGSSLCLMRVSNWKKISIGQQEITVPTVLWFVNGASVYIKRPNPKNFKPGSDKYALDKEFKNILPAKSTESILIQKPFDRWFDEYPTPFLIRKGILQNYLALKAIQSKSNEVINKVLPYLFLIKKGTQESANRGVTPTDPDLKELVKAVKAGLEKQRTKKSDVPVQAVPFDQDESHLIPDLTNVLKEELYNQGYRTLLLGLGFVDIIQGISNTRKESILNPKPFISEVNAGVEGFKSMIMDVVRLISSENKGEHKKFFSDYAYIKVVNSPLKINVEAMLDQLRSGYVYGAISIQTYHETLGIDHEQEIERMKKEWDDNLRESFYPHLTQNQEDKGIDTQAPLTKKQIEKQKEKTKKPTTMNKAGQEDNLIIAPYTKENYPDYLNKYPQGAIDLWIQVWNETYNKEQDEQKSFQAAWIALNNWLKKYGYKKNKDGTVTKAEE
jgi:hypothetical protein